jgi:catechol 2,3-dioxygenase-like lactoylglutathione lyase family enzyme
MDDAPEIEITEVTTVGIPVADQDRAVAFYCDTLRFETRLDVPIDGTARWIVMGPPGSTTTVALVAASERQPAGVDTGIRLTVCDAEAGLAALQARGAFTGQLQRWPGVPPMFEFRDPDGNLLYAVEPARAEVPG